MKLQISCLTPGKPGYLPMGSMVSISFLQTKADEEIVVYDSN